MKQTNFILFLVFLSSNLYCQWSELGGSFSLKAYDIKDIEINSKNEIFTLGLFQSNNYLDTSNQRFILKFDGTKWTSINSLTDYSILKNVSNIEIDKSDNIYFVNAYQKDSGYYFIGKYNGTSFIELKGLKFPQNKLEKVLYCDDSSNIYIGGKAVNDNEFYIYKYNGLKWDTLISYKNLGDVNWVANILLNKSNELIFNVRLNNGQYKIISLKNKDPKIIGHFNNYVSNLILGKDNKLYAGGQFTKNSFETYVAVYDDSTWKVLGDSTWRYNTFATDALLSDNIGNFYTICGPTSQNNRYKLAKFNGLNWTYFESNFRSDFFGSKMILNNNNSILINSNSRNDSLLYYISKFDLNYSNIIYSNKIEYKIYPNPFHNSIKITLPKISNKITIQVFDLQGRVIKNDFYKKKDEIEIDLNLINSGNYILNITTEEQTISRRINKI